MHVLMLTMVVFGVGACAVDAMQSAGNFSEDRILSRRRRYLIFPDGSSLQLGMCESMSILSPFTCKAYTKIFSL